MYDLDIWIKEKWNEYFEKKEIKQVPVQKPISRPYRQISHADILQKYKKQELEKKKQKEKFARSFENNKKKSKTDAFELLKRFR